MMWKHWGKACGWPGCSLRSLPGGGAAALRTPPQDISTFLNNFKVGYHNLMQGFAKSHKETWKHREKLVPAPKIIEVSEAEGP